MWIVRIALNRPYTFIVLAVLIVLLGGFTVVRTATDIFPNIPIPVVATIWSYSGLSPDDMAGRIITNTERTAQTTVNDVEHTESQSLNGIGVVKYFFHPNVDEEMAYAQITGVSQTQLKNAPPGTTPPFVLAYNASSVPVIQLALSSETIPESRMNDLGNTLIRTALSTVSGASMPYPYGGRQRQIQVDLDPTALRANGLSAQDVSTAIGAQNLIIPAGTEKIGDTEYYLRMNSSLARPEELNDVPVAVHNGNMIYVRDVAHVRDGSPPQTNIVRVNGARAVLMSVLKTGNASTLDIIDDIKSKLPDIGAAMPPGLAINALGDQSIFVRAAISGVMREGVIAAALTGLMILLFLGNFRSTLIITISIPLSMLLSIICLSALHQTINIMTLGGLALAVGILVDDATVTIENINYHLEQGKDVEQAILDGAQQIALPALVSTFAICIVFLPMFFLSGIAKFLFVPLAEAVVFAMLGSYMLSRTLVPTLAKYWLKRHDPRDHDEYGEESLFRRFQHRFERRFEDLRDRYHVLLERAIGGGVRFAAVFLGIMAATALLAFPIGPLPGLGQDFFPAVDGGQIKLHVRGPIGLRIEQTAMLCDHIEATIKKAIPRRELDSIVDNIGMPYSGINLSYSTSAPIGPSDADIYVSLKPGHAPTARYVRNLREELHAEFPSVTFAFLPADITSQILNFGLPSPLDIQIAGFNSEANRVFANRLLGKLQTIPGAVDLRIQQARDYPQFDIAVNRSNAQQLGFTQQTIASELLISLSGSFQTAPSFWLDPATSSQYNVTTQVPQYRLDSLNTLGTTPLTSGVGAGEIAPQLLANLADVKRDVAPAVVSHYNATPLIDIYGGVDGIDLGYVANQVNNVIAESTKELPKGSHVTLRGQVQTMQSSFNGLLIGLAAAIILVYLLIVVNFQSWVDPFIIITALPAALAGIVWMLFITYTTVSVPALTGAIMCMGVATANSILLVSFARERLDAGLSPRDAAIEAGVTRLRPVMMTALAMIIGMIPMALALGEGGEQNAPLGRAVIGGLMFATIATLFLVPTTFTLIHEHLAVRAQRRSGDAHARA